MKEQDIADALARIEAKVDALTEWSGMFDMDGRPIPKLEMAERDRRQEEIDVRWDEQERERGSEPPVGRWSFLRR